MTDDDRKAVIRSMLLLELNSIFSNTWRRIGLKSTEKDRQYLKGLIEILKDVLRDRPVGRNIRESREFLDYLHRSQEETRWQIEPAREAIETSREVIEPDPQEE